jgi:hypothetical protein
MAAFYGSGMVNTKIRFGPQARPERQLSAPFAAAAFTRSDSPDARP